MLNFLKKINNYYTLNRLIRQHILAHFGPFIKDNLYLKSEPYYQEIISVTKKYIQPNIKVLDIGCAAGRMVFEYSKMGASESVGIDNIHERINICNDLYKEGHVYEYEIPKTSKNVYFEYSKLENFKNDGEKFDFISCLNVIDRVNDPQKVEEKIYGLLKQGGKTIFTDPYDWEFSPASKNKYVDDMKKLFDPKKWKLLEEKRGISYTVPLTPIKDRTYPDCHLVVFEKI